MNLAILTEMRFSPALAYTSGEIEKCKSLNDFHVDFVCIGSVTAGLTTMNEPLRISSILKS